MPANLFKKSGYANGLGIFILSMGFLINYFQTGGGQNFINTAGGFLIVIFIYQINKYITYGIWKSKSAAVMIVWALLVMDFPNEYQADRYVLSYVFVSWVLIKIYRLSAGKKVLLNLFDAGIIAGISTWLYPESFIFILWIYAGYFIYYKIIDRHVLYPLAGWAVSMLIIATIYFIAGDTGAFISRLEWQIMPFRPKIYPVKGIFWGLTALLGFGFYALKYSGFVNRVKDRFLLSLVYGMLALFLFFINSERSGILIYTFLPVSYYVGETIDSITRKTLRNILGILLITTAVLLRFFSF